MSRVSVIIPVYNSANYISEALDSVLTQTYHDYEIIVVDDGSTDHIGKVLAPYENKINYFYQDNQGSAVARNLGIAKAQGEFIAFLDADDFWLLPNKLDEQVNYLLKDPRLGSVHTGWRVVDGDGRKVIDVEPWYSVPELDLVSWLMYKPIRLSGMIIRQSGLAKVGGFDGDLRQSHDVDLMLRLALLGCSAIWWPVVAVGYRKYGGNTTRNARVQADCVVRVLDKFFGDENLPENIRGMESEVRYHSLVWLAWYHYDQGLYVEMVDFFRRSLVYTPYYRVETIGDWVERFKQFSRENGSLLDISALTDLEEWQGLMVDG